MARLTDSLRSALGYWWNLITDAVQQGFTTAETTQVANQVAQEFGSSLSFDENRAIATLYGYAKRMDNAAAAFQNAPADLYITPDLIATPPYARDEQEQATYPQYHVKFYYEYIDQAGNQLVDIKTSVIPFAVGPTVGDVFSDILSDAEAFAAKYGHQLVSATPFQILAV